MNAAEAAFQNRLATKALRHHARQRASVRRLAPTSSVSCLIRAAVAPCRIVSTSTTTAPRYTLRPRNRSDGGVSRVRQPSSAQQKLNRWLQASMSPASPPRGLRWNRAE